VSEWVVVVEVAEEVVVKEEEEVVVVVVVVVVQGRGREVEVQVEELGGLLETTNPLAASEGEA
jgi:hypothetical protein